MARTSGAIGMPTQTGTHTLVVGWSATRKLEMKSSLTSELPVIRPQSPLKVPTIAIVIC